MKQIITFLFFLLLLTGSCSNENRVVMSQLAHINSLMEVNPQAAYDSLRKDSSFFFQEGERCVKMKYRLLMAKAQNKLYLQMPSDSLFQEVVDYYDANGTSNERMEAHYLMGCVFRDQTEAVLAIRSFEQAVEFADTLDKDCDFVTLCSIYGQMVDIYTSQSLWQSALESTRQYCKYALKNENMSSYIGGKEQLATLYYSLGDTTKAMSQIEQCISLYKKEGMPERAAGAVPLLANICLKKKQYEKAFQYIQTFEKKSGEFNEKGDISKGREYYYNLKGLYFLGVGQLDSARCYFQKLDGFGFHFEAKRGMLGICVKTHNWKEAIRYMCSCEAAMEQILENNQTKAVLFASKMYDVQRMEMKIHKQQFAKKQAEVKLLVVSLITIVLVIASFYIFRFYKRKLAETRADLDSKQKLLELKQTEVETWNDKFLTASNELQQCKEKLLEFQTRKEHENSQEDDLIDDEPMFQFFKNKAAGKYADMNLTDFTWGKLEKVVSKFFPSFSQFVGKSESRKKLSKKEWYVVLLTRLHFSNSEMATVLSASPASISNAKQVANEKLYGDKNAKTLFYNIQHELPL